MSSVYLYGLFVRCESAQYLTRARRVIYGNYTSVHYDVQLIYEQEPVKKLRAVRQIDNIAKILIALVECKVL